MKKEDKIVKKEAVACPSPTHRNGDDYKRNVERSIHVRGEIEAKFPEVLIKQHETERKEESAHEKKKFLLDKITVTLTISVLLLNVLLVYYTRQAIIDNGKQFQSDQRPHVWTLEEPIDQHKIHLVPNDKMW